VRNIRLKFSARALTFRSSIYSWTCVDCIFTAQPLIISLSSSQTPTPAQIPQTPGLIY
jgi:hypothetical protein